MLVVQGLLGCLMMSALNWVSSDCHVFGPMEPQRVFEHVISICAEWAVSKLNFMIMARATIDSRVAIYGSTRKPSKLSVTIQAHLLWMWVSLASNSIYTTQQFFSLLCKNYCQSFTNCLIWTLLLSSSDCTYWRTECLPQPATVASLCIVYG